ncbi:MAG: hypothetical protein E6L02_03300 [Thaumarchaeota archaeon]|nr:MAG: hypothetical protein E6L02_03300 [Nitrososphaerota archaeon]
MKKELILLGFIVFVAISSAPVFASNAQVYITNSTSTKECAYTPSCFLPYQVTISLGDTVTWINIDNKTHTVTTGTTNFGPVGTFDSGYIEPGKSFTQFFGSIGKYRYFDKTNPWVTGIVLVETGKPSHAELAWVNGSLNILDKFGNNTSIPIAGQPITIAKDITNSGNTDANAIMFRLKIKTDTNYLVYDKIVKANISARQTVPISFSWLPEKSGSYHLFFEADPSNPIGDTNENNDITFDTLIVSNGTISYMVNSTLNNNTTAVPEFGPSASIILVTAIILIIVFSSKLKFARY